MQDEPSEQNWYVIRVHSGKEEKVKESLERTVKAKSLENEISRIIVPIEKITEIRGGKKTVKEKKLYPGYIVIKMNMNERTWFAIRETPGVGDFLGLKKPIPMSAREVERILNLMSGEQPRIKIDFQKGDTVSVKEGPFENFEGVVEEIDTEKGIVTISLTIFGRSTKVDLEYWQVEKV
jgi:transcriptional antiterminator NusG